MVVKAIMADALNLRSRAMAKEAGRDGEHWRPAYEQCLVDQVTNPAGGQCGKLIRGGSGRRWCVLLSRPKNPTSTTTEKNF
jgi:hypothetical protein